MDRLVLQARLVLMDGRVVDDGRLFIEGERIEAWRAKGDPGPSGYGNAARIDLSAHDLFPGLLDLHNHPPYNVFPLWLPSRKFEGREQWRASRGYRREVREPSKLLAAKPAKVHRAVARYVEVKALLGGATSLQGISSKRSDYHGLTRNLELGMPDALVSIHTRVQDLRDEDLPGFLDKLAQGRPMFFHLAEGVSKPAKQQARWVQDERLLRSNLVCIHCLGLSPEDHQRLDLAGCRVVWSPLSNLLLYGQTLDMAQLRKPFALACDWTPSGSRNLLLELKVAWLCDQHRPVADRLGPERLVQAVTCDAATVCQWNKQLGQLVPNKLADCLAVERRHSDPYLGLIQANERNISLIVLGGQAVYGDERLMHVLTTPERREVLDVGGRPKALVVPDSVSLAASRDLLFREMADLNGSSAELLGFSNGDDDGFRLQFDMDEGLAEETNGDQDDTQGAPFAFGEAPLNSVSLDPLTVIDDRTLLDRIQAVAHIPTQLRLNKLKDFYSV